MRTLGLLVARKSVRTSPIREIKQIESRAGHHGRKFHLEVDSEKTRLLELGAYATEPRQRRRLGKPETFNFLGFTHICGKKRSSGRFTVLRHRNRKRMQAKLQAIKTELRHRMHRPLREQGAWLRSVVGGHTRYYGVPTNAPALYIFRFQVGQTLIPYATPTEPAP